MNYLKQLKTTQRKLVELKTLFENLKIKNVELRKTNEEQAIRIEEQAIRIKELEKINGELEKINGEQAEHIEKQAKDIDNGLYELEKNINLLNNILGEIKTNKTILLNEPNNESLKVRNMELDSERLHLKASIGHMAKTMGRTLSYDWIEHKYKLVR